MIQFMSNSLFFGAAISLIAYEAGLLLKRKFKMAIFNPLLIAIIAVIAVLCLMHIDYDTYNQSGQYISYLLTCDQTDPASCTCKCVRTGDHADRTGNTHYQAGTGQRGS